MKPIVLIEDDENDVLFLQAALQKAGVLKPLEVFSDARRAIDYFTGTGLFASRPLSPLPCLILLDLKLPGLSGFEFLKWLRAEPLFKTIIVIALTSSTLDSDIQRAYALGVNSYIAKPSNHAHLIEFAGLLKSYWLNWNYPPPECNPAAAAEVETA
jgi:CheY-like chemotaxis protein